MLKSKFIDNKSDHTLVLYHGTGGNIDVLIPLAKHIAPNFNILSFEGDVIMGGMRRFCKVSERDAVMDEDDMFERVPYILKSLDECIKKYNLKKLWALGFSNGANTITAMLLNEETPFDKAILIRPMDILTIGPISDLKGLDILIHSGRYDDVIPMESSVDLEYRFRGMNAQVENNIYDLDHRMRQFEMDDLKTWIERKLEDE